MDYRVAIQEDFEQLLEIRIKAMKPSLEKIGRFDPKRAKKRFYDSFIPENTTVISINNSVVGFYMVTDMKTEIKLNHLYIDPKNQGLGIGTLIMDRVKILAIEKKLPIILEALKESPSNNFYLSKGFIKISESEFDNNYRWNIV